MVAELRLGAGFQLKRIHIYVDSQYAIKALISYSPKSAVVTLCKKGAKITFEKMSL